MNNIKLYLDKDSISYKDENGKIWCTTKRIDSKIPLIVFKEQTVEELAIEYSKMYATENKKAELGYVSGYNTARSSDKKYTEENIETAFLEGMFTEDSSKTVNECIEFLIQKLNQPNLPDVINLEMEEIELIYDYAQRLKTTSTPEGEIIEITV